MRAFNRFMCLAVLIVAGLGVVGAQTATTAQPAPSAGNAAAVDETTLVLPDAAGTAGASSGSSMLPYFIRMVLVLGLVIASIYGLYALLRRSAKPGSVPDSYLRVLATTNLAAGRNLHVVALGESAWLIGSTDASIGLISEIKDKELIDALALRAAEAPETPRKDFSSMLVELLGRKRGQPASKLDPSDFFSRQKDRLKKF